MNFIKNLFHRHTWKTVGRAKGKAKVGNMFGMTSEKTDVALCLDRCSCGKERAYLSTYLGDESVGLNYAKSTLGMI